MSISNWPKEDRPREKLLRLGAHLLTDAELVALLLATGTRGKTALDLAKELLVEFDGLKGLLATDFVNLRHKIGFGLAKFVLLQAAKELGLRALAVSLPLDKPLKNSQLTQQFIADKLRRHRNEVFACLFLDVQLRVLGFEELFFGTLDETTIYPREIVKRGLALNAGKVVLAHNHPSGEALPSNADIETTLLIQKALALVNIEVVDHVIIGYSGHYSFAEHGIL